MTNEQSTKSPELLLPSLDNLTDEEYLEQSKIFGRQWVGYIKNESATDGFPAVFNQLEAILQTRSMQFNQLPENDREKFLIAQQGVRLPDMGPLTGALFEKANVRTREIRPGVPEVLTNGRYNEQLFGTQRLNFCINGVMEEEEGLPFIVSFDSGENSTVLNPVDVHEVSHILWHTAAHQNLIPGLVRERDAADSLQRAFLMIQDEGVSISTAGEPQFTHSGIIRILKNADATDRDSILDDYHNLDTLYRSVIPKIETQDLTLGIMQARNFQDLFDHFQRMANIVESMPELERDYAMDLV